MDCKIFNVYMSSCCMHMLTVEPRLVVVSEGALWGKELAQRFDLGEVAHSRRAKSRARNGHPSLLVSTLDRA